MKPKYFLFTVVLSQFVLKAFQKVKILLILVVLVTYHAHMKLAKMRSYREAIELIIFDKNPSLRDYCNKNKDLISHATLSRVLRKYKNGKFVCDTTLSDEKFFKILRSKNFTPEDLLYLYMLKKQEELRQVLPSSHPLIDSLHNLIDNLGLKSSSEEKPSASNNVVNLCLEILPEKLKKSIYVELLKKLDYYQQGSSLQARFKNILSLRQKLKSKIDAI